MRNAIVLTTVLLILAPACVKAVDPIGWWKFDEKDGTGRYPENVHGKTSAKSRVKNGIKSRAKNRK
jgi:hypothetical protein